jgi:hypothetical protein
VGEVVRVRGSVAKDLKGKADFTRIRGLSPIRDAEMVRA